MKLLLVTLATLAAVIGLSDTSSAQTATGTTIAGYYLSPLYGPMPGAATVAVSAATNTFASITNIVTTTAYTNVPTQTTLTTTNSGGIVLTNIVLTGATFTNTLVTLNPNYIVLAGAKTLNVWVSGACTNSSGTTALTFCYSLSSDGVNWTTRNGLLLMTWTPNGTNIITTHTNLDCSSAAFAKLLQIENPDSTYSYNVTNSYVLRQ